MELKILTIVFISKQKYFGDPAHSILNPTMKNFCFSNLLVFVYSTESERKGYCSKKVEMFAFFFPKSNIHCIKWEMLEDLSFLWITELYWLYNCCFWELCVACSLVLLDDSTTFHNKNKKNVYSSNNGEIALRCCNSKEQQWSKNAKN